MSFKIQNKIPLDMKKFNITKIDSGASKKIFYRLKNNKESYIITDFNYDKKEYDNYLKVYEILKKINISIPKLFEKNDKDLIIISEDLGNLRYDKTFHKGSIKNLLKYAVDTLLILNRSLIFQKNLNLSKYSFKNFVKEIEELPDYFFPHKKLNQISELRDEYINLWTNSFKEIDFNFKNFAHKDFNINNLIHLPSREGHLKCGVIDFQGAFWGESSWDLFSLLEDSRVFFTDKFNEDLINYFYQNSSQTISLKDFMLKFHFLNCARQSRLLGRWVKLSEDFNQKFYLNFIDVTMNRLKKSIPYINNNSLKNFYNKYILTNEY